MGIELHGLTHDVGGFCPRSGQQTHFIHGIKELSVGGLEAVNLRYGPGNDDRHGVGHVVCFQCLGYGLLQRLGLKPHNVGIVVPFYFVFRVLFSWHILNTVHFLKVERTFFLLPFLPVSRLRRQLGQYTTLEAPRNMRLPQ